MLGDFTKHLNHCIKSLVCFEFGALATQRLMQNRFYLQSGGGLSFAYMLNTQNSLHNTAGTPFPCCYRQTPTSGVCLNFPFIANVKWQRIMHVYMCVELIYRFIPLFKTALKAHQKLLPDGLFKLSYTWKLNQILGSRLIVCPMTIKWIILRNEEKCVINSKSFYSLI